MVQEFIPKKKIGVIIRIGYGKTFFKKIVLWNS